MPLSKLVFKPGINKDQTNYASEGGWADMDKVRFRSGYPEKIGGWLVQTFQQYAGEARLLFPWGLTTGNRLLCIGTNEKIYVTAGTTLYDITPIRITYTNGTTPSTGNCFGTTNGSTTVLVTLASHGADEGAYVTFSGAVAVGGVTAPNLNKEFKISNVTTNTFEITVASAATSTVSAGGGTSISAAFQINIGYENVTAGFGWGTGTWGRGTWGSSSTSPIYFDARLFSADNFNSDLIFNIADGSIYYWTYDANFSTRAVLMSSLGGAVAVPQQVGTIIFAPSGHLIAMSCTEYDAGGSSPNYLGPLNQLLIRWADVSADIGPDPLNWKPELTNTAGFLYLQSGTRIITAFHAKQETLIWTDISLSSMQYLGTAEVFGVQEIANGVSIIGGNVVASANNVIYWMGNDKFYTYNGRVDTLPCTVRQYVFENINRQQGQIFLAGTNNQFNEIVWFYCSANATEIDRYVIYNYSDNIWYYGNINRTAWVDAGIYTYPLAAHDGWVYTHENGNDDGQPLGVAPVAMESFIQSADVDIEDGDKFMLIRRIIPDVNFTNSETTNPVTGAPITPEATITVGVRNFPGAASSTTNASGISSNRDIVTASATINQYTNQVFIRARGRQMNFRIESSNVGTQWQLGMPRVDARPDGTRG
jgi:DNA-binding protein